MSYSKGVCSNCCMKEHYDDAIMGAIGSQITSLTIVYSTVYSGADQSKHQSSASQAFVWGIHRGPVNSPHKWPVTRKRFPLDDVMVLSWLHKWPLRSISQSICGSHPRLLTNLCCFYAYMLGWFGHNFTHVNRDVQSWYVQSSTIYT